MQTRSKRTVPTLPDPMPRPVPIARGTEPETSSLQSLRTSNEALTRRVNELESQLPHPTLSSQLQWKDYGPEFNSSVMLWWVGEDFKILEVRNKTEDVKKQVPKRSLKPN